jgi:hypothetical protein
MRREKKKSMRKIWTNKQDNTLTRDPLKKKIIREKAKEERQNRQRQIEAESPAALSDHYKGIDEQRNLTAKSFADPTEAIEL